ncbi:hypothetical protein TVAG_249990 [Trichomonas vaginalis G3]|uniref:Uncharacterized protein n=1 Tax=Trichomonas vaginalis (strain ATCC PRA-98 / G3) TaxID=412133 RepID=A2DCK2_TRIV3|nr:hypothetical protein TVAGG3_0956360 [Trichomonas vaginalis G3]EAY21939.1 hypothetical protein TVAG_249990 [Trichomonas vaginalis G3]KAI5487585.1 hypothetical protein TVAGG3_0956360 [Trichomonas vaginalis G3]|eukprot:XP_001582925.1 hypothetical protein [Trichomonas vaginalis G3]
MLPLLVSFGISVSKFVVTYGYSELTISEESQLELEKGLYPFSKYYAFFINNEDFQDLNMIYSANYTLFSPTVIPKNGPTVLKFIISKLNVDNIDSLSIVYNGGDVSYNTFNFTKPKQYVLFLSSTEFNYRFEYKEGYLNSQTSPYEDFTESHKYYENGHKRYLLIEVKKYFGAQTTIVNVRMEKVYPEIETTGFYRLDSCILSNNDTFQFYEPDSILLTGPGKYEFLIGEEEKNIPYLTSEQIFPHQCNDILIKVRDNWIEWENMISTYNLKGIKSKSGKKIVRFEIYFLGFEEKQFDVIVNPRENEVFRGEYNNNVLRHPVVLITSWYPMNFSQLWNYTSLDCEPENYETKNKLDMKAKFIGVTKLCITIKYYNKISQFVFCNFSRSENFDYSNLVNKVFHLDNNKIFVDKWDGEVILYEYFEYSTDKDIYFNAEQYKIIIVKSKWGFQNAWFISLITMNSYLKMARLQKNSIYSGGMI